MLYLSCSSRTEHCVRGHVVTSGNHRTHGHNPVRRHINERTHIVRNRRQISSVLLLSLLFLTTITGYGCIRDKRIGEKAVIREQCHLFDNPNTFFNVKRAEMARDHILLGKIINSERTKWIYKGYVVKIERIKGPLATVVEISPRQGTGHWWIPLTDVSVGPKGNQDLIYF